MHHPRGQVAPGLIGATLVKVGGVVPLRLYLTGRGTRRFGSQNDGRRVYDIRLVWAKGNAHELVPLVPVLDERHRRPVGRQ
ncbi:MAG: hypothetical protein BRD39_05350 [Bacteroidetes bacterium QH_9_64_21]|nr:MAG: hypothetical protein BRD39_05350 [Bacteroidetes bacterium QH_9_64_21]